MFALFYCWLIKYFVIHIYHIIHSTLYCGSYCTMCSPLKQTFAKPRPTLLLCPAVRDTLCLWGAGLGDGSMAWMESLSDGASWSPSLLPRSMWRWERHRDTRTGVWRWCRGIRAWRLLGTLCSSEAVAGQTSSRVRRRLFKGLNAGGTPEGSVVSLFFWNWCNL